MMREHVTNMSHGTEESLWLLRGRYLCEGADVSRDPQFTRDGKLTPEAFCRGLKGLGTGIMLEPNDVAFVFGSGESIGFARFCEWCG